MRRAFVLLLLSLLTIRTGFAQADSAQLRSGSLTLAAIYGNNANYYGQTAEERLPYILTNASLRLRGGVYFSLGSYKLINTGDAAISELDLSAGFETDLTKKLNASFGYTRSFFAQNSPLLQAANENTLSASFLYDLNILKAGLNSYYAFGTQQDVFMSFTASKTLNLGSLFSKKDFISFEPGFELVGGTLHYLEEYIVQRDRREGEGWLSPNPLFPVRDQYYTLTRDASSFDMLSYNMNLLFGYNRSNYLIETGWTLSSLGKNVSDTWQKSRSFFNLSLYYQF